MKYDNPELRDQLAAEYALGTMPPLVRRRFERLLAADPELVAIVEEWTSRFRPIDGTASALEPPARVWRAVERRIASRPEPTARRPEWLRSLAFWRIATLAASATAAAAILYAVSLAPTPPASVVAVLNDDKGEAAWIATSEPRRGEIAVAPIRKVAIDAAHAFELWAIAGGPPRPLGLLAPEPDRPLTVQASLMPPAGVLAVSVEPAGGSPTGLPTGPVLYKGNVLSGAP
jgi:anti-sigma-K factor RskA